MQSEHMKKIKSLRTELILKRVVLLQWFLFSFVRYFFTQNMTAGRFVLPLCGNMILQKVLKPRDFFLPFLQSSVACGTAAYFMSTCWVKLCFQKTTSAQKSGKPWELHKFCFFSVGEWRALLELETCSVFSCASLGTEIDSADLNSSERKFSLSEQKRCASEISLILARELNLSCRISAVATAQLRNQALAGRWAYFKLGRMPVTATCKNSGYFKGMVPHQKVGLASQHQPPLCSVLILACSLL